MALDTAAEIRLLNTARAIGEGEPVRIVTDFAGRPRVSPRSEGRAGREAYVAMIVEEMIPAVAKAGLATSVDAFCETIAFTPAEVERVFTAARAHGLPVRLHAEQLSNQNGAALGRALQGAFGRPSRTSRRRGRQGDGRRGHRRGAATRRFLRASGNAQAPVQLLRDHHVPIAIATDCNPGTSPLLNPQLAMNMACTLFGLTPEEAITGMTINAARALGLAHDIGTVEAGKAADLCAWRRR